MFENNNGSSQSLQATTAFVAVVIPCFILLTLLLALTVCMLPIRLWIRPTPPPEAIARERPAGPPRS